MGDPEKTMIGEVDLTGPGGMGARLRGFRVMDLICAAGFALSGYTAMGIFNHHAEAKDNAKQVAEAIKESAKEQAAVLARVADEQRRSTEQIAISNCLLSLPMSERNGTRAMDVCNRIVRGSTR